jgi:hypothetical protein
MRATALKRFPIVRIILAADRPYAFAAQRR